MGCRIDNRNCGAPGTHAKGWSAWGIALRVGLGGRVWPWALAAGAALALTACTAALAPPPVTVTPPIAAPTSTAEIIVAVVPAAASPEASAAPFVVPFEVGPGQHLSAHGSYTETETEAAGPMICQIERDSCAFSRLVINRDPLLLFSEGEAAPYGLEDRMMHSALVLPLNTLAQAVAAEWQGVQVMITEAYDSQFQHNLGQQPNPQRYSLHFEGRSVDLITWPPDTSRTGRLCALALGAGFAWVHNEDDHCHASVSAGSLCFECSFTAP